MASYLTNNEAIPKSNTEMLRKASTGASLPDILAALENLSVEATNPYLQNVIYGSSANSLSAESFSPTLVYAPKTGAGTSYTTYGIETHVYSGDSLQEGDSTKYFNIWKINVDSIVNPHPAIFDICTGGIDTVKGICTASTNVTTEVLTKTLGTAPVENDRIMVVAVTNTTGVSTYRNYFAAQVSGNTFSLATDTSGTNIVDLGGTNGTVSYVFVTDFEVVTSFPVFVSSGGQEIQVTCPKIPCNKRVWIRGQHSDTTDEITSVSAFLNLHLF